MSNSIQSPTILRTRDEQFGIYLNEETGLPEKLFFQRQKSEVTIPLNVEAELITEGQEVPRHPQGMEYTNTKRINSFRRQGTILHRVEGEKETYSVTVVAEGWQVVWHYTFRAQHPRLELSFDIGPLVSNEEHIEGATLRAVRLTANFCPTSLADWQVEAPGNQIRPGVSADLIQEPLHISSIGGVDGSTGLLAFHQPQTRQVVVIWPFSRTEIGVLQLQRQGEILQFTIDTELAGRLIAGEVLHYEAIEMDALDSMWGEVRDDISQWYAPLGLYTPNDRVEWIKTASIFEVQIGRSIFWNGYEYAPYPEVKDLLADLERIQSLGYTMLQIMPRQPYPSYNVHDYADINTSYGNEEDLRTLVALCHEKGMHVILDILMHGVIDKEIIAETAKKVRSGPYFARLNEPSDWFSPFYPASDAEAVSWSRHILDFEPYWSGGSPTHHPLADEHPEWFMRNSAQQIIGIYTKAFDVANPAWQEYFMQATEDLVKRLDIDGFRFDAPTYNNLPNWSAATEKRASYSPLGSLTLFQRLRPRLKALKNDIILYTEPSGVAFRQTMDITYNYDEQWLSHSVLDQRLSEQQQGVGVRNGHELASWFHERNTVLPYGSLIAHHIDSHDTFWWPLVGNKWRREQYGLPATSALMAVFSLSGGAYMTFVGGEEGIENDVRKVHRLRATLPEIGIGTVDYHALTTDKDALYSVVRQQGEQCSLLLVNLSPQSFEARCTLDHSQMSLTEGTYQFYDAWNTEASEYKELHLSEQQTPSFWLAFEPFQVYVLVLRRIV